MIYGTYNSAVIYCRLYFSNRAQFSSTAETHNSVAEAHNSVAIDCRSYLSNRAQLSSIGHTTRFCGCILFELFV